MATAPDQRSRTTAEGLEQRYREVRQRIADAAGRSGREGEDIVLAVVTKHAAIDQIRELVELGHVDFAENRVQALVQRVAQIEEFLQRQRELRSAGRRKLPQQLRWHMVGHLQRNKVRKVLGLVRLIHSVDSLRLAEEIQSAVRGDEPVEVLVQVNIAAEKSKYGVAPAAVPHLIEQIDTMIGLRPRGLMCIAPLVENPEETRPVFERCRELMADVRRWGLGGDQFDILSMGMSNDYEVAVECGANIVRVGTAIFGAAEAGGGT